MDPEDPLEKEMATLFSFLAWEIPWTEEPSGLQTMKLQSRTQLSDRLSLSLFNFIYQFSSIQSLSRVRLFATP